MYLPVPGFEPTSSEFLDKCATCKATVADDKKYSCGHICLFVGFPYHIVKNGLFSISDRNCPKPFYNPLNIIGPEALNGMEFWVQL